VSGALLQGDARQLPLANASVQCVVTSPPYWGLRDYGLPASVWDADEACAHVWGADLAARGGSGWDTFADYRTDGRAGKRAIGEWDVKHGAFCQRCPAWRGVLGLEPTPELYVAHVVQCFREIRRVLRGDGVVWLNLGDSYFATGRGPSDLAPDRGFHTAVTRENFPLNGTYRHATLKQKDLVGIPWRVAFALQADGWYLRADVIWAKPNPMPESVTDRPTKAHEYLFLLAKSERYFYDGEAIREAPAGYDRRGGRAPYTANSDHHNGSPSFHQMAVNGRNRRSVWTIGTEPFPDAHFATFPEALVIPCVLAGSRLGDVVLDPFAGSGTVGEVAERLGRHWVCVDLSAPYGQLARMRTRQRGLRWHAAVNGNGNGHDRQPVQIAGWL
jgi:DNA modification methylase